MKSPGGFASIEDFFAAFTDDVGGLIPYVDAAGRVQYASRALAQWFETPADAIRGRTLAELYGAQTYAQIAPWTDRALAGEDVHYERQAMRRDGTAVWLSVNLRPHRDARGKVLGYFSCALEVDELMRTHEALGRALDELATHIENTPLAVVEWSADLAVKRWSPQAEAIFGWTTDEVLGRKPGDLGLVHAESVEAVRALTRELAEGRQRRNRMLSRNHTKDGRVVWCQWRAWTRRSSCGRPRCMTRSPAFRTATRSPRGSSTRSCA